jgi:hypothetical protein
MVSSGMLCHVALVRTDILEELSASIIMVIRISELGTLGVTSNWRMVLTRATQRNIPEDGILRSHRHENLKSYDNFYCCYYHHP